MEKKARKQKTSQSDSHKAQTLGYARTSTDAQWLDRQVTALQGICDEVFIEDGVSATSKKRPVYDRLITTLKAGDTLAVLSIDRVFRSTKDALNALDQLEARGISFLSLQQQFDTSTPEGKLMRTMMVAVAEFELNNLRERTKQGLQAARARGTTLGRPRKLTPSQIEHARSVLRGPHANAANNAATLHRLATELNVHERTIKRAIG